MGVMRVLKVIKRVLIGIVAVVILVPVGFIGYVSLMNPVHDPVEVVVVENNQEVFADDKTVFTAMTFNLGYAGLDETQDFFADGGTRSRAASEEKVEENLKALTDVIKTQDADFYLLQEIDRSASRSYDVEQYERLKLEMNHYASGFAYNYNAIWVPIPFKNPMGYANAGLGTFSRYKKSAMTRIEFEGQESWPKRLGELDRCMMQSDIPLTSGKTLSLLNVHLSAYDKGGELRGKQVEHLITYMNALYDKGNYVVVGGDWNQLLIQDDAYGENVILPEWLVRVPNTLTETGFQWAVDEKTNTVRDLATAYEKGKTFVTVIDGFLVSPNVTIIDIKGQDLEFKYSDHNPVKLTFKLNEE